jgi:iron complex outermembrane receptor protein
MAIYMKTAHWICSGLACVSLAFVPSLSTAQVPELDQIVVTASRYEEDVQRVPSSLIVLTRQELADSGASSINEAISRLTGILARPSLYGGNEMNLDLGGFGDTAGSNLVVVIDGVPYKQGDASEVRLSSLSLDQIERVEIQRGASTVLYGEGAVGGVINIITKANTSQFAKSSMATASVGLGSKNTREARAAATFVNQGLSLSYAGLNRTTDGFRQQSAGKDRNNNLALQFRAEQARVGLNYAETSEFAQTPGGLTFEQYAADRTAAQPDSVANNTWNRGQSSSAGLFVEAALKEVVWRMDYKHRQRDYSALAVQYGAPVNMTFMTHSDVLAFTGTQFSTLSVGKNSLVFGADHSSWKQDRNYPDSSDRVNLVSKSSALFVKNDLDLTQQGLRITAGYRSEQLQKSQDILPGGNVFTAGFAGNNATLSGWELGLSQTINSANSVYVRRSQSYRLPNIDEIGGAPWLGSGPMPLNPQTAQENELGWKYRLADSTRVGLRVFQSELRNEIIFDPSQFANINLEPTRRRGIDLDVSHRLSRQLLLGGVMSYKAADFASGSYAGKAIPMVPRQSASLRGVWSLASQHTVSAYANLLGSQQVAGDFSNQSPKVAGYATADLRYAYKTRELEASIMIRNLFNRNYFSYGTDVHPWGAPKFISLYPDNLRNFMAVVKYTYQ